MCRSGRFKKQWSPFANTSQRAALLTNAESAQCASQASVVDLLQNAKLTKCDSKASAGEEPARGLGQRRGERLLSSW